MTQKSDANVFQPAPPDDDPPPTELSADSEAIDAGLNDSDLGAEALGGMASKPPPGSPGPQTPSGKKTKP